MGLTLIRKSTGTRPKANPKVALVLAGGAVSGGAFKVGGLKALDDYLVDRKITDLDTYIGLSAGSILAVSLAGGVKPDEMIKVLEGTSTKLEQLAPHHFYHPNLSEFVNRPARFLVDLLTYTPSVAVELARQIPDLPNVVGPSLRALIDKPSYTRVEELVMRLIEHVSPKREVPSLTNLVPTGLFDTRGLEQWLSGSLEKMGVPNDFRAFESDLGKRLYIAACDLDTAERVVFGPDEKADVSISKAVQASTALPLFFRPARIGGIDYIDGGIRNTANIDVAIEKGADLIICYNPFRPFHNRLSEPGEEEHFVAGAPLADGGMLNVINQVFRTLLHSRLRSALQRYVSDTRFKGDIVLLEPREHDAEFFGMNPLAFWKRADAIREGFESARVSIESNFDELSAVLGRYGLEMNRSSARRRASRLRAARGWRVSKTDAPQAGGRSPKLKVVGA
ncbi:MAG: patatin-like phospholipase family protein [Deltaproteobacteria bacterium]|nr:patatin-like phospholipase family protein [Deltaproteobacteria bacterium]MBW2395361.1 patatin-like phospholipase family protein [Deltaproteobacteria bacterium]